MPKSRVVQWAVTGVVAALLLAMVIAGVALRGRIAVATGLDRPAAAPSIDETVFVEPTESSAPITPHLEPPAATAGDGASPVGKVLTQQINALDTSKILTADGKPATLAWEAIDASSGKVIASRNPQTMLIPASNTKTLTMVALFSAFEGHERFRTTVTQPSPGTIVLVGRGDALLTAEPVPAGTYPRPPSLRELATDTARALKQAGHTSVVLHYDASWFEGPTWAPTWPAKYRDQVTPISALWADEGKVGGVRQQDPALAATQVFAKQLGELGITVQGAPTPGRGSGTELAAVDSLPVRVIAEQAMQHSNNSYSEVLGRQVARKMGKPASFTGATAAITEQLTALGVWQPGAHLDDASGLSRTNHFSAHMLATANLHLLTDARLTGILDGLPVAGVTGTLGKRFTDDTSGPARGVARAKTGTLSLVSTLGGHTTTADGRLVVFAVMANGQTDGWAAKVWEDQVAGVITGCGC